VALVAETIETKASYLLPGSMTRNRVPDWPPDVFCLCAAILQNSGAYSRVIDDVGSKSKNETGKQRASRLRKVGLAWKKSFASRISPKTVSALWREVFIGRTTVLSDLGSDEASAVRNALLELLAISDEACADLGIYKLDPQLRDDGGLGAFRFEAENLFVKSMSGAGGATLCKGVHASRARVLPKMHTPQSGLTIRSLSHHLGYCPGSDMRPNWLSLASSRKSHSFNLLIIPWPSVVEPSQFSASKKKGLSDEVKAGGYGLFTFHLKKGPPVEFVQSLLSEAEQRVGHVDGIVFPELAMDETEFNAITKAVATTSRFVVSGVGTSAHSSAGTNVAILEVVDPLLKDKVGDHVHVQIPQKKHHRWKLEKNQITQYGIGSNLHPLANWWEHIQLGDREISFVSVQPWLTMSVLICEDLARPDPVGDVIRAVGPNLIIALLSDGPQIGSRWPGRYASGFADDPGSSVLTVTSLGMSKLSRPQDPSKDRSNTVVLWRDARSGTHEIACPTDSEGIVLNVTAEYHEEWTADGRGDGKNSGYPVLSGYHLIKRPPGPEGSGEHDNDLDQGRSHSVPPVEAATGARSAITDQPLRERRENTGSDPKARGHSVKRAPSKSKARLNSRNLSNNERP
jgi:hypothetical protein